ncbi:MAG: hypothetical protein KBC74_00725 [Candidatus Pacebacteria bacterium]|nr:hypothetical protein [Candidatus Paceibacterota bacterium]MBP9832037.1 hypothetical protein [Candidatus Paceibacterota bacterium]
MAFDGHIEVAVAETNSLSAMWDDLHLWGTHPDADAQPRYSYEPKGWSPQYEPDAEHPEATPSKKSGWGEAFIGLLLGWMVKRAQKKNKKHT